MDAAGIVAVVIVDRPTVLLTNVNFTISTVVAADRTTTLRRRNDAI